MHDFQPSSPTRAQIAMRPTDQSAYTRGHAVLTDPAFIPKQKLKLRSKLQIWVSALATGMLVFLLALGLQWIIYDRYLHEYGVRIVGSMIAAVIAIVLVETLAMRSRDQRKREIERLKTIALLNHHIRNALQAIVGYSGSSNSTDAIRSSVERIEWALGEVLPDLSRPANSESNPPTP